MVRAARLSTAAFAVLVGIVGHAQNSVVTVLSEVKAPEPWMQAPTSFRDVPFGATFAEAQAVLGPMKCSDIELPKSQSCTTKDRSKAFRVGGTVINTYYQFYEGKFVGVSMMEGIMASTQKYGPATYRELATAFEQKYGTPSIKKRLRFTGVRPETVNPLTGRRPAEAYDYAADVVVWENDAVHIYLTEASGGKLSYGVVETRDWQRVKDEAQKQRQTSVSPF
ncbi:MAG: hypothetical protein ABI779_07015 [Acidobacteriota bacterium]